MTAADFDVSGALERARALVAIERDAIANAANLAAFVRQELGALNWAGFYIVRRDQLVLGPFCGKPAIVRIARGSGVCGSAWDQCRTLVVPDVHAFAGHIVCDIASRSEIVVPLVRDRRVVAVLDVDSPIPARFGAPERRFLESLAALHVEASDPF